MKTQSLKTVFNQLAENEGNRDADQARRQLRTIFNTLLKAVYTQVRGQAPLRIVRDLMEAEIEIGGEEGDFKTFDNRQMIELFRRGQVAGHMRAAVGEDADLAAAVDIDAIGRWLASIDANSTSPSAVRLVCSWLRLCAEATGLVDPAESTASADIPADLQPTNQKWQLPQPEEPFADPLTGMTFVFIPGGTFTMGDTFGDGSEDEQPVHEVTLSPFYMAVCPVTQAQWNALMDENPSGFVDDRHPVEQVTFNDVMAFIGAMNAAAPEGVRFDLPTEAQWEYAARSGGLDERYAGGQDAEAVAWFNDSNEGRTAPVGSKAPNGLGLYDMSGNVWEWCRDIYVASAYRQHDAVDPVCEAGGRDRVIRGGSWHLDAWSVRCSRRFRFDPELFGPGLGFRVVMTFEK